MNGPSVLRIAVRLLLVAVLAASGWYFLLYLYRWEWSRAIISGVFFVAAEIVLVASLLGQQIARLGRRIEHLERSDDGVARRITGANAARSSRAFAWMRDTEGSTGVFIPVLMGAGVILSALAYAVERVASAVAGPNVDRATARRLALDLPLGTMDVAAMGSARATSAPVARIARVGWWIVALGALGILAFGAVDALRDVTESTAESDEGPATLVSLEIGQRTPIRPLDEVSRALTVSCLHRLTSGTEIVALTPTAPDRVEVTVVPGLGELRRRRFFGCLEDGTLDRVNARVVAWELLLEPPPDPGAATG